MHKTPTSDPLHTLLTIALSYVISTDKDALTTYMVVLLTSVNVISAYHR